ncbi:hypothetical protein RRG08_032149 [Elysia crispata]|uniref:Uncharacterized protein n=1 Tax=Elysia crispata TaxID=231223 RepID=A0AAE1DX23_9GAST|nr:hypothetical protein RRG08_032149 [Elysia crispata]
MLNVSLSDIIASMLLCNGEREKGTSCPLKCESSRTYRALRLYKVTIHNPGTQFGERPDKEDSSDTGRGPVEIFVRLIRGQVVRERLQKIIRRRWLMV